VAAIDLRAGQRAKGSAAYASACVYLAAGMALIGTDAFDNPSRYELAFALCLERAECELLSGNFDEAEWLIDQLVQRGASRVDKAAAYILKIHLHIIKSEKPQGVDAALECLCLFGIEMPTHPTREEVQAEYEIVWKNLKEQSIESLVDLPLMTDLEMRAAMRVLGFLTGPALYTDINLYHLHFCKMVTLSLEYGISDAATFGYAGLGVILCVPFHRYAEGYRFAKLACDLVEKHGFAAYKARVHLSMEMVALWTRPIEFGVELTRTAFRAATESGDLAFACYSCMHLITNLLIQGAHLDDVWRESETCLDFVRKGKYVDAADVIISQQQLIRHLRGQTATFSTFSDEKFDENSFEARLTEDRMTPLISRYWILKVQARFMSGDYRAGLAAVERAKKWHWSSEAFFHSLDYYYYGALTVAACFENGSADEQREWRELLATHQEQLRKWADSYPPTFADKHALVLAEIARLDGRDADAMRLYEQAIRSASDHGFMQNEALGHEVAARFYAARGFETIATAYLRNARYCYLRWGADGKVRQLDRLRPHLAVAEGNRQTATIGSTVQELDVASVVKASQAVSSEIVLPRLIERLMTIALENAGADRGLLILPAEDDYLIQAEAQATGDRIDVALCQKPIRGITCPESLVRYVIRTHENVILEDASRPNLFSDDVYLRGRQPKSILCLPLMNQGRLTGLLYLENTLTSSAFTPDRTAVLELLASQAAISLENTRLYSDLQEREAKVRRLVDSNIIGIFIWDSEGRIIEANEAFLHLVGHSRDDLASGRLRWTALTPIEWSGIDEQAVAEVKATGSCKAYEKEYLRRDGVRVPVLVGGASLGGRRDQGVAFVLDLSERKQAEESLRESDRRYREAQMALAHANRVTTMGQLTASIAHEVNQPIAAAVTHAHAALRWLDGHTPNLEEVRRALDAIVKDGIRAGDVIGRIRALINKVPPRHDRLDINEAILEVIEVARSELLRNGVSLQTELAQGLPVIQGDRIQLQQIVLNMIMNAVEAMSEASNGPRDLLISTAEDMSKGVLVTVRDSGPGLSPENLDRLFDAFYTTKSGGMGMGLSICRSIIEAHGGRVWATANLPQGACFHFSLPAHGVNAP
jgi:PAS domain S-box-containing protein